MALREGMVLVLFRDPEPSATAMRSRKRTPERNTPWAGGDRRYRRALGITRLREKLMRQSNNLIAALAVALLWGPAQAEVKDPLPDSLSLGASRYMPRSTWVTLTR